MISPKLPYLLLVWFFIGFIYGEISKHWTTEAQILGGLILLIIGVPLLVLWMLNDQRKR